MTKNPTYGHTEDGLAVHKHTRDFHGSETFWERVNQKVGLRITLLVGTMWCAYLFAVIALLSLPQAISSGNLVIIIAWISSNFLQLVLLPIIIVGQNIQSKAADARAAKTFEDVEKILKALDLKYEGGLSELKEHQDAQHEAVLTLLRPTKRSAPARRRDSKGRYVKTTKAPRKR